MPPLDGDESSGSADDIPPTKKKNQKAAIKVEEEEKSEEEEEDELDEDEYVVEKINAHKFDKKGDLFFEVQWQGYKETTWEPKENLDGCEDEVNAYYEEIGGEPKFNNNRALPKKGNKKRKLSDSAPAEDSSPAPTAPPKSGRGRKPKDEPAAAAKPELEFPPGSWEDAVLNIDTIEQDEDGRIYAYVLWNDGRRTRHQSAVVNKKCPQKMLRFYEAHLQFNQRKTSKAPSDTNGALKEEIMNDAEDEEDVKGVAMGS